MAGATTLIGLLPTYESIGYWAAFLLVILRFVQGMAMGGEWGGAVLMAVEHAPEGKKGFWGSLPQASAGGGLMLASMALWLVSLMPEPILFSWGWRLPFLASILLLGVGWYIRVKVPESPDFEKVKAKAEEIKVPALQVFKNHPKQVLTIIIARAAENAWFYGVDLRFGLYHHAAGHSAPGNPVRHNLRRRRNHADDAAVRASVR